MYRVLPLLLCLSITSPAPQSKPTDSDVTFVKIQPVVEDRAPVEVGKRRESRIENLPLTIPGNLNQDSGQGGPNSGQEIGSNSEQNSGQRALNSGQNAARVSDQNVAPNSSQDTLNNNQDDSQNNDQNRQNSDSDQERQNSDQNVDLNTNQDTPNIVTSNSEKSNNLPEETEAKDILPAETNSARQGRNYDSYETTEFFEIATDRYDDVTDAPTSKRPKFGQTPKLSYFQKPYERVSTNLIEKSTRRRFRSRCRCEKIWNCPKLQITVPRCPNEYFLCCF